MKVGSSAKALVVIDVQKGFDELEYWGPTTNIDCESNVARLIEFWRVKDCGPVVAVRHDSVESDSPLRPDQPGNQLKDMVTAAVPDLLITKTVNSAFLGQPRLDDWLHTHGISTIVCCGIQTNMCVETTARMGGNLGFKVVVALDATRTFDLASRLPDGTEDRISAADLMRTTAVNLQGGGFATIVSTNDLLSETIGGDFAHYKS